MIKVFLPPRVALIATNVANPVTNPATGLLVYNTAISGGSPINVARGYYYWNGSSWYPVVNKGASTGDMQYWNGTKWINIPLGLNGQSLTICNGIPAWGICSNTLTINPSNNVFEGNINPYTPNAWIGASPQFYIEAWTNGGAPYLGRFLIKFDQSALPSNAVIDSAKLYLYGDHSPINGNQIDAHFGPANAFYIQRIMSPWTVANIYNWNSQPTTVSTNQVLVAQSTSSFQDEVINVTALIKDIQANGNNGLFMKLQSENVYNIRQYLSSFNADATKHPKLVISYH